MIVIDDADAAKLAPHTLLVNDQAASQSANGLPLGSVHSTDSPTALARSPPTGTRTIITGCDMPSDALHTTPRLPPPAPPPSYPKPAPSAPVLTAPQRRPQSPTNRFCKAFAIALLIYLTLISLARFIIFHMASGGGIHWDDGSVGVPRAEDGQILHSIGSLNWTTYQGRPSWAPTFSQSAETSFILPTASDALYLISRGSYQSGKVELKQSTAELHRDGSGVRVDVRVAYHDQRALARATLCQLRKSGNRHGVGIYTPIPGWSISHDRLYFEVIVTFPAAPSERSPLRIHEFTTHTSNFAHEIGDLWQSLLFENIELDTANAPIQAHSVTLTKGSLTSSNGAIVGHFNTSDSLVLRTSNARIQVTASLFNTGRDTTKLDMRTSNGQITASVSLTTASGSGGNFVVTARSSNGGVTLHYDDTPTGARLVSDARTSNAAAHVGMHPAYEGTFEVSTSNARPVVRDTHPTDPEGRGRRRVVDQTVSRGTVAGRVYWVGEDRRRRVEGTSTVHTSNAQASLDL